MSIEKLKDTILTGRFINEAKKQKESASYLFYSDKRVDLLFYALEFSKLLLCENMKDNYCDECKTCKSIDNFMYPDVEVINRENGLIKIDIVREIIHKAVESPYNSGKKIYIINGVEKLRKESANALLKLIEEPPKNMYFILLSKSMNIIPTIKSRAFLFYIKPLSYEILDVEREVYEFFDGNVKDIEKWQGNRKEITYKNIETWEILENLRVFYLYKELYTLLSGNFENDDITGKKEFMKKSDFKLVKDLLKDLLLVYNDEEIKFITDKMKNNGNFAESLEKILIFLEKIYIDIRVKYITSIHSLALNYSHYSNSAQLDIIMGINDIFSQNKEDLREFLDRLLLKKKDGIKALKRIIEIKNSIENNVNLKSVISNFFMFYK